MFATPAVGAPTVSDAVDVATAFSLGRPVAPAREVAGGLLNRVWRVRTTKGLFAVKQVSCDEDGPIYAQPRPAAFAVEREALAAGIPMPTPILLPGSDDYLAELRRAAGPPLLMRVHAWVEGYQPRLGLHERTLADQVGATIARLHQLPPAPELEYEGALDLPGEARWAELWERSQGLEACWSGRLARLRPVLSELGELVVEARTDAEPPVMTHGDADSKNFLVTTGGLVVLDWDAAGLGRASHEIAAVALHWAGVNTGPADEGIAQCLLEGYQAAGGALRPPAPSTFAGFFADLLRWLEFNLRRCLDDGVRDRERARAVRQVAHAATNLPRFANSIDRWVRLLA